MNDPPKPKPERDPMTTTPRTSKARAHHIRQGLRLTPAERLRWLEETVAEMRQLQGLARKSGGRSQPDLKSGR